jgi:hypothetical protein
VVGEGPLPGHPEEWEAEARGNEEEKEASFQRCDTDGFLSQWANGIHASLCRLKAEVARMGGTAQFKGLYDRATGQRVRAVLVERYNKFSYSYEDVWKVMDEAGRAVQWVPAHKQGSRSKIFQLGYVERMERAPADAQIIGRGTGLSGTAWPAVVRTDDGWSGGVLSGEV